MWEEALLELEQKEIDKRQAQQQQDEIAKFFENKKQQIEAEKQIKQQEDQLLLEQ